MQPHQPPPFRSVLLLFQTIQMLDKSRRAVVHSLTRHQSYSNQFPVPDCTECGGQQVLGWVPSLLFPSGLVTLHHSGQIPETVALYCTPGR
jgi:hypothetical protein